MFLKILSKYWWLILAHGMGALVYSPEIKHEKATALVPELDTQAAEMNQVLQGTSS